MHAYKYVSHMNVVAIHKVALRIGTEGSMHLILTKEHVCVYFILEHMLCMQRHYGFFMLCW